MHNITAYTYICTCTLMYTNKSAHPQAHKHNYILSRVIYLFHNLFQCIRMSICTQTYLFCPWNKLRHFGKDGLNTHWCLQINDKTNIIRRLSYI